jgi:hypothetical protein
VGSLLNNGPRSAPEPQSLFPSPQEIATAIGEDTATGEVIATAIGEVVATGEVIATATGEVVGVTVIETATGEDMVTGEGIATATGEDMAGVGATVVTGGARGAGSMMAGPRASASGATVAILGRPGGRRGRIGGARGGMMTGPLSGRSLPKRRSQRSPRRRPLPGT